MLLNQAWASGHPQPAPRYPARWSRPRSRAWRRCRGGSASAAP